VRTATIEFLKIKLEEDGLYFRGSIPNDGNSFFKACSDQLQRLEISGLTHTELRQMVIPTLKFCSEVSIITLFFIIYMDSQWHICDKVCQWLATGWWFSPGTPVSSTNKTDCHVITEISGIEHHKPTYILSSIYLQYTLKN
jgi:hypothetical protein